MEAWTTEDVAAVLLWLERIHYSVSLLGLFCFIFVGMWAVVRVMHYWRFERIK